MKNLFNKIKGKFKNYFVRANFFLPKTTIIWLSLLPRYKQTEVKIIGKKIKMVDPASFLFMYNEIFLKRIYKFNTTSIKPYILDCGANIGLSVIYFKMLYPNCKIVAFEPDKKIFRILKQNIRCFNYNDIKLVPKGIWKEKTTVDFQPDGSDGGRISSPGDQKIIKIETLSLRDYLYKKVDFLKIDIEGVEVEVFEDIKNKLRYVDKIFVEYHSFRYQKQCLDKLLKILTDNKFRYFIEHIGVRSKYPYLKINTSMGMDLQLNIYAYKD